MTPAECTDLIDRLDELGIAFLELSGGEPLVRQDIFEILEHCASKSFRFTLFTNGVLIDVPGTVDKLLRIHELSKGSFSIHVSLDGGQPEGHDWLRGGKGLFQRTRNALSLISDRGIPARVVESVVTRQSMHQFEALVELCLQNGIGHVHLHPALNFEPSGNGLSLSFEDRLRCFEKTMDLKCRVHDAIAFDYDDPGFPIGLCHTPELREAKIKTVKLFLEMAHANAAGKRNLEQDRLPSRVCETPAGCGETLNCSAGITRMFVTACGDVYPCLLFVGSKRDFCGNAVEKGLLEIWESQGMARARIPLTRDLFRFCSRCDGYDRCGRRAKKCRIGAERALGDFFGPSPLCVDYARQLGLPSEILDIYGGRE
jgi:radical SAM protein with 4Fe4S-binding SPASM domain